MIARSKSSIDIRRVRRFFLLSTIPKIPIRKRRKKKSINSVGKRQSIIKESGSSHKRKEWKGHRAQS